MSGVIEEDSLLGALRDPTSLLALATNDWNGLLKRARMSGLAARLACQLQALGLLDRVPDKARDQMLGAHIGAELSQTGIRFELDRVLRALRNSDVAVVLLKGAAYLMADLPPARGRASVDVDLMVPAERLDEVEQALLAAGWESAELSPYDDHFYRAWAHEIPALIHPNRDVQVDIHHTILERTARAKPDCTALFEEIVPLADARLAVLSPADMVLHCAAHMFHGDLSSGLRELVDLDDLLRHFGAERDFWEQLTARAKRHRLTRTYYYALRYARHFLHTPVPAGTQAAARMGAPPAPIRALMDVLITKAILPHAGSKPPRLPVRLARLALYVRSHWIRMPPTLLAYHLSVKAWRRADEWLRERRGGR